MGISRVSQIGNFTNAEEITQRLAVQDYVLEINQEDIKEVELSYYFDKIKNIDYVDGKKKDISFAPIIGISLSGINSANNKAWISFMINIGLEQLNEFTSVPTDISEFVIDSESFIKYPEFELSEFLNFDFASNNEDDIYKNLSSVWVSKLDKNIFVFKICIPNEVFSFFKINFNKDNLMKEL